MPMYEVEVVGRAREVYVVEADSAEDARENWWQYTTKPVVTEVYDTEVTDVHEEED